MSDTFDHTAPETFKIRFQFSITEDMKRAAEARGTTASVLVRDVLNDAFALMKTEREANGWFHGYPTDCSGRIKRGREFAIAS